MYKKYHIKPCVSQSLQDFVYILSSILVFRQAKQARSAGWVGLARQARQAWWSRQARSVWWVGWLDRIERLDQTGGPGLQGRLDRVDQQAGLGWQGSLYRLGRPDQPGELGWQGRLDRLSRPDQQAGLGWQGRLDRLGARCHVARAKVAGCVMVQVKIWITQHSPTHCV